jgi:hypothetical protein
MVTGGSGTAIAAISMAVCVVCLAYPPAAGAQPLRARPLPSEAEPGPADLSALHAWVVGPGNLEYDPHSLGIAGKFVGLLLENPGPSAVALPRLHASFRAVREGVAFPCNAHVGAPAAGPAEPSWLGPGQSFAFERLLDCTMPLTGHYDVSVWIHPATGELADHGPPQGAVFVGSFGVDLTARSGQAPRPVPGHPGLYALVTGASTAAPMTEEAWSKGAYQVALALVNGSSRTVSLGGARMQLLVVKRGAKLPCAGRVEPLAEPATLAPGEVHVVHVPVTCVPAGEGQYEVTGRLSIGGEPAITVGRFGLLVTGNPYLLYTPMWPQPLLVPNP